MSGAEAVVWCVGLLCTTVVICVAIISFAYMIAGNQDKKAETSNGE
jgi:hypothetical protein